MHPRSLRTASLLCLRTETLTPSHLLLSAPLAWAKDPAARQYTTTHFNRDRHIGHEATPDILLLCGISTIPTRCPRLLAGLAIKWAQLPKAASFQVLCRTIRGTPVALA